MIQGLITYLLIGVAYYCLTINRTNRVARKVAEKTDIASYLSPNWVHALNVSIVIVLWIVFVPLAILRKLGLRKDKLKDE